MACLRPVPLGGLLLASAAVQGYMIATDAFLRSAQPLLAGALALFLGVDLALAVALLAPDPRPLDLALPWAALQLLGLLVNPLLGFQAGMSPGAFATYLLGLWAYDALLGLRALQLLLGLALLAGHRRALAGLPPRGAALPRRARG
jgi:hypothetical protein